MASTILLAFVGILSTAFAASVIYNVYLHPLRKIPGPWLHAASTWPYIFATMKGHLPLTLHDLHQKYGPVVRTAPNEVSFIEKGACKAIYVDRDTRGYVFPKNYDTWTETSNYFTHSVFLTGADNHRRIRRALGPAFSERALREHDSTIMTNVDRFLLQLHKDIDSQSTQLRAGGPPCARIDLDERFHWLAFDTASEFVFGDSFNCLVSPRYRDWLRKLSTTWKFIAVLSSMKQIVSIVTRLLSPTGLLQSRVDALVTLDMKTEEQLKQVSEKPSLLSICQPPSDDDNKDQAAGTLSKTEIKANTALFTIAATDTTASVMPSVVYLLLRHQNVLEKLLSQVRSISHEDDITPLRAQDIPYLTACISEAMRMYPAVPEGLPRVVPGEGQEISGYWIPPKTAVQLSSYAAYRSPINFEEPDAFIPERWLSESSKVQWSDEKGVFHPFSLGPRGCIGKNFAMGEICYALVKLLWHFDMTLDSNGDWLDQRCFLLWERKPLVVRLTPRFQETSSDG